MAGASPRRQQPHRRLFRQFAEEILRVAVAGPGLDAKIRRRRQRPEGDMREILDLDDKARARARGGGDNLSLVIVKIEPLVEEKKPPRLLAV